MPEKFKLTSPPAEKPKKEPFLIEGENFIPPDELTKLEGGRPYKILPRKESLKRIKQLRRQLKEEDEENQPPFFKKSK